MRAVVVTCALVLAMVTGCGGGGTEEEPVDEQAALERARDATRAIAPDLIGAIVAATGGEPIAVSGRYVGGDFAVTRTRAISYEVVGSVDLAASEEPRVMTAIARSLEQAGFTVMEPVDRDEAAGLDASRDGVAVGITLQQRQRRLLLRASDGELYRLPDDDVRRLASQPDPEPIPVG